MVTTLGSILSLKISLRVLLYIRMPTLLLHSSISLAINTPAYSQSIQTTTEQAYYHTTSEPMTLTPQKMITESKIFTPANKATHSNVG